MAKAQVVLALDSGALINAEKDRRVEAVIRKWLAEGATILIPAVALAEVFRGTAKDAAANRLVKAVGFVPPATEAIGRSAGARAAKAPKATMDALIVATAEAHGTTDILTTDPIDIRRLANPKTHVISLASRSTKLLRRLG